MKHDELAGLYSVARNHHMRRRDDALSRCRRYITRPGKCEVSIAYECIREWFDDWEQQLWQTYEREKRSLAISWANGQGDPGRPSGAGEADKALHRRQHLGG